MGAEVMELLHQLNKAKDEEPQDNLIILTPRQVNQMKEEINAGQNEKN